MSRIAFHLNCLAQGGAERVVSSLANQLCAMGEDVFIATEWQEENEFEIDKKITRVHVGLREADEKKSRIIKFMLRIRYLKRFVNEYKPDILIAFAQRANYRALMAAGNSDIPVIISIRTDPVGHYDALSDKIQIRWLFPKAAGCVFQTKGQKEFFYPYLQENSRIILNPINSKYIGVESVAESAKEKAVVHHARLVDFKNQPLLLKAFIRVHEKYPDYILRLYGGDSGDGTKEILEDIIKTNHAQDYIFLMGASDNLEHELPKGMIYAFSSDWEGLPNSVLEAMALGMPVISTDCPCGGPATVIRNMENGLLIPIKDEIALADAMIKLIEDRELALSLGNEARNISDIANSASVAEQWISYIQFILNNKRRH
ncbi:MAG: glycosyltransferase [Lachnospiraceae bacterium]|nr:glycosyltransferase [Lachnospiraceae bacterium]